MFSLLCLTFSSSCCSFFEGNCCDLEVSKIYSKNKNIIIIPLELELTDVLGVLGFGIFVIGSGSCGMGSISFFIGCAKN